MTDMMTDMVREAAPADPTGPAAELPLFYRDPRPLSSIEHADWRLRQGDAGFAATTPYVPILPGEFVPAARHYPIVFAASDAMPIALLGLEQANLFVDEGLWADGHYVPAYVRRYPFGFIRADGDRYILAIDAASDRVLSGGGEGVPLFGNGEPSADTRQALTFCEAFQAEVGQTLALAAALRAQDLLIEQRVDARLPTGRELGLQGFQIVDAERFAALPDAIVVDWHRRGWLALVVHHLASLDRFEMLLARQNRREAAPIAQEIA